MAMDVPNRLSEIAAEMEQLQNEIREHHRVLNFLLISVRRRDPAEREERINAARENLMEKQRRLQVLQTEQQELIVQAINRGDRENH